MYGVSRVVEFAQLVRVEQSVELGQQSMMELETLGIMSVANVTKCNAAALLAQVRAFHHSKGMDYDANVRADPGGKISQALDPKKLGPGAYDSGQRRGSVYEQS